MEPLMVLLWGAANTLHDGSRQLFVVQLVGSRQLLGNELGLAGQEWQ